MNMKKKNNLLLWIIVVTLSAIIILLGNKTAMRGLDMFSESASEDQRATVEEVLEKETNAGKTPEQKKGT